MNIQTQRFSGYGGVTLTADVGGDPTHPSVILMHGGGQTRHSWGKAARDLVKMGLHVISLDLRGHGESDWAPDGDYSIDAFIGDLKSIIAKLSRKVALVGASRGGVVALIALGENTELPASALILVDVVPHMDKTSVTRIQDFMLANPQGFATLDEASNAVARYLPNRPRPTSKEGLRKNLRTGPNERLYWHWDPKFLSYVKTDTQREEIFRRMDAAAHHITAPTLIVRGKESDLVSREGVEHLRQLIPHAECVDVEDAGHMVVGDKNDKFNAAVERFLGSVTFTG
ncbi:MAG: alpha/beta hydrolase [Proteobacteria bacterium]|nr:alpha/beta hydrolase [Pseudomonadota bacterium]